MKLSLQFCPWRTKRAFGADPIHSEDIFSAVRVLRASLLRPGEERNILSV